MVDIPRPKQLLINIGKHYDGIWKIADGIRIDQECKNWPNWCFVPYEVFVDIISTDDEDSLLSKGRAVDCSILCALAAWRVGQGIYRFDPVLYQPLIDTSITGDIPCDILYHLPQWCVYIETPGLKAGGDPAFGVFVHLNFNLTTKLGELHLLFDCENGTKSDFLILGKYSLLESIQRHAIHAKEVLAKIDVVIDQKTFNEDTQASMANCAPVISLLLYLCSQSHEIGAHDNRPQNIKPKRTKRGTKFFPPEKTTTWNVGQRIGAALTRAYLRINETDKGLTNEHSSIRPHVRRAHWHGFRTGPQKGEDGTLIPAKDRKFTLHWLPPIPVNVDDYDALPAVIHPLKE